jgi:hypothetical protein
MSNHVVAGIDLSKFRFTNSMHFDYTDKAVWMRECPELGIGLESTYWRKTKNQINEYRLGGVDKAYPTLETLVMENKTLIRNRITEYEAKEQIKNGLEILKELKP